MNSDNNADKIVFPETGIWKKVIYILKYHIHFILFTYIWFGMFICGLVAQVNRVALLDSKIITEGWHLSVLSMILVLPWPVLYLVRFIRASRKKV